MAKTTAGRAPWKRTNPRKTQGEPSTPLTAGQKQEARTRARRAGRPYPNLVDNMAVSRRSRATNKR